MNAERLLEHYEKIADAPDAIVRLRKFILDLAVRGKLVPQDPNDEPASELLKRIAKERARLVKAGEIRKPKEFSPLEDREVLPIGWTVTRLDGLSPRSLCDGDWIETKDQSEDGGIRLIQLADVGVGEFLNKSARYITEETEARLNCTRLVVGDVLIARLPNPIGRACIFPDIGQPAITAVDVAILRPDANVSGEFLVLAMNAPPIREQIEAYGKGATRFRVSTGHLKTIQIPLPPLAEQHRIVGKVDELMALCDQLEAARTARETTRDRLAAASLSRLNSPDSETFHDDAVFAVEALPALTARPDQIKQLRHTILNLAVRGKLVPQDPTDELAAELLTRIGEERAARSRMGAIPKPKITSRDVNRFSEGLPIGWSPIALGDVCDLVTSGSRGWAEYYADSGPGFVRAQNIRFGRMRLDDLAFVNPPSNSEGSRTQVYKNDLLIVITGAGVTNPALLERDLGEAYVSQHVGLVRPSDSSLSPWLLLCLMADAGGRSELVECAYGAGKPGLNLDNIRSLSVPLPSLAEQHRIVAKVAELMALCDQLEASLTTADETRRKLLDALLAAALAPVNAEDLQEAAE